MDYGSRWLNYCKQRKNKWEDKRKNLRFTHIFQSKSTVEMLNPFLLLCIVLVKLSSEITNLLHRSMSLFLKEIEMCKVWQGN